MTRYIKFKTDVVEGLEKRPTKTGDDDNRMVILGVPRTVPLEIILKAALTFGAVIKIKRLYNGNQIFVSFIERSLAREALIFFRSAILKRCERSLQMPSDPHTGAKIMDMNEKLDCPKTVKEANMYRLLNAAFGFKLNSITLIVSEKNHCYGAVLKFNEEIVTKEQEKHIANLHCLSVHDCFEDKRR